MRGGSVVRRVARREGFIGGDSREYVVVGSLKWKSDRNLPVNESLVEAVALVVLLLEDAIDASRAAREGRVSEKAPSVVYALGAFENT